MKILIALLFFNLNLANALDLSKKEFTKYELLNSYFLNAQRPILEEIKGWWSGRCYEKDMPNAANGGLLIISPFIGNLQNFPDGPLFPTTKVGSEFNMVNFRVFDVSADYFDFPNGLLENIHKISISGEFDKYNAFYDDYSIVSINEDLNILLSSRKYENYLLTQIKRHHSVPNGVVGEILVSCYYFKKIK